MLDNAKTLNSNTVIFKEGDPADRLVLIKSGQIICLKSSGDKLVPVFLGQNQDIIGESAMFEEVPYTYSAIALTSCEVVFIERQHFTDVFKEAPQWLHDLSLTMVSRFQSTAELLAQNRIVHNLIVDDELFAPAKQVEYKKLLSQ